jgi:DNA repair exonuclease SbcCD ATPase subunit
MQEFDTSMTNAQFDTYYSDRNPKLLKFADDYKTELGTLTSQIAPIKVDIQVKNSKLQEAQAEVDSLQRQKSQYEILRNQYQRIANSGNFFTRGWLRAMYTPRVNQMDGIIRDINNKIPPAQQKLEGLIEEMKNYNSTLNQLLSNESTAINNKNKNDNDRVILIKQQFFYGRREEGCKDLTALIANQETLLKQYNTELTDLNKQYADCNANYNNTCSVANRNEVTTLIAERDEESKQLDKKYEQYESECKDKIQDCKPLLTVFQQKQAEYDDETKKRNKLDEEYNTCIDPTKNKCKDSYNDTIFNKSVTETSVDMIKPSTPKSSEGFTQYGANDSADSTHAKLVTNYKSVQNDYTKLKQNIQELNNANNNYNSKTSRYATKKQLYDNAIYTNILLTALATSMLYYVFVEI